jgi:hypothetical protein
MLYFGKDYIMNAVSSCWRNESAADSDWSRLALDPGEL